MSIEKHPLGHKLRPTYDQKARAMVQEAFPILSDSGVKDIMGAAETLWHAGVADYPLDILEALIKCAKQFEPNNQPA